MIPRLRIPTSFPPTEIREAFGRDWIWPSGDHWGWKHPLDHWPEMETLIKHHVSDAPRGVVVQAGGCCGMYPWLLTRMFRKVYTFEPDAHNFSCLVQNCATPQVAAFNCALGDEPGLIRMTDVPKGNVGNGHMMWGTAGEVVSTTLDGFEIQRCDALLLDAESSEERIVRSAIMTIETCKPRLIMIETITEKLVSMLHGCGYDLQPQLGYDHHFLPREGKTAAATSGQQLRRPQPSAAEE